MPRGSQDRSDARLARQRSSWSACWRAAEAGGRNGSVIDILVLQALARHARGDAAGALASLERALALAEPEGYVRIFLDEGPPMAALLKLAAKQPNAPGYVRRLLAAVATARDGRRSSSP